MDKYVLERHKAGAFIEGGNNAFAIIKELLEKEENEANQNLGKAKETEEESDYSDAMLSMDRTYAEGFSDALALAIRLIDEASK
jgi:hypothetical protein